jgi:hypothetical protein
VYNLCVLLRDDRDPAHAERPALQLPPQAPGTGDPKIATISRAEGGQLQARVRRLGADLADPVFTPRI